MASVTTKRRSGRQAATRKRSKYVDPESDDDFMLDDEAEYLPESAAAAPAPAPAQPASKKRKVSRKTSRPQTRSKAAKTKPTTQTRIIGKSRKPRTTVGDNVESGKFKGPSDGKIPDWTSLPLAILRDIFAFASEPLDNDSASSRTLR